MEVKTMSGDMERKLLTKDLKTERDSDEDGGEKTRCEVDSDFSYESEEENHREEEPDPGAPKTDWASVLDKQRPKGNTGPKGVKADYEQATRITRRRNETKKMQQDEKFKRMVYGAQSKNFVSTYDADNEDLGNDADNDDDRSDDDDDDDDGGDFLASYRAQRMNQMKATSGLPHFGRLKPVDRFEFLDEVDKADPRTFVVIHLYEQYIELCRRMNDVLERLAHRHGHVKFLKLEATEADQELTHSALPAFMVYQGGQLTNEPGINVVATELDGNEKFTDADVEWLLAARYGIHLPGVDVTTAETQAQGGVTGMSALEQELSQMQVVGSIGPNGAFISNNGGGGGAPNIAQTTRGAAIVSDDDDDDDDDWGAPSRSKIRSGGTGASLQNVADDDDDFFD